jgi:hypothetical protein
MKPELPVRAGSSKNGGTDAAGNHIKEVFFNAY